MVYVFLALFIGVPVVWHWFSFNRAEVSARCAFLIGIGCAAYAWLVLHWQIGILVFFLATLCEFAVAYAIGLVYWSFASAARTDYMDRLKSAPQNESRNVVGAVGAVAIPLFIFGAWVAAGLQTGTWELSPAKALIGYCAFLVLAVAAVIGIGANRRIRKQKRDAAA